MNPLNRILTAIVWLAFFIIGIVKIDKTIWLILYALLFVGIAALIVAFERAPTMPDNYDEPHEYKSMK